MPPAQRDQPSGGVSSASQPAVEPLEVFLSPYTEATLHVLQGSACRYCRATRTRLIPAGQGVSVTAGKRITWDLRRCESCGESHR